jgi:hypothetical protein
MQAHLHTHNLPCEKEEQGREVHKWATYVRFQQGLPMLQLIITEIRFAVEQFSILTFRLRTVVSDWSKSASRSRNLSISSPSTSVPVRCLKISQIKFCHSHLLENLTELPIYHTYNYIMKDMQFQMRTPNLICLRRSSLTCLSCLKVFCIFYRNQKWTTWMLLQNINERRIKHLNTIIFLYNIKC